MNVLGPYGDGGNIYNEHYNVVASWLALAVFIREIMGLMIICFVYGNTRTNPPRPDFKIRHDPSLPRFYLSF